MQTNSRSRQPTTRRDDAARVVAIMEREFRPLTVAALRHAAGVPAAVLETMVTRGEIEIVGRGLLRLAHREPRQ